MLTLAEACRRLGERNPNWLRGYCDGKGIPLDRVGQSVLMTEESFGIVQRCYRKDRRRKAVA